jgi:hypothetical protein
MPLQYEQFSKSEFPMYHKHPQTTDASTDGG